MGMSIRLGKSNAWNVSEDSDNNISISSELVERTSEKTTYKVIVTIDYLSKRMNRRVADGEIYVCLYEKCRDSKGFNQSHYRYDPCPSYALHHNLVHTFGSTTDSHQYLQKVVRGKKRYIYTVTLNADVSDCYYDGYNDYYRLVDKVKWHNSVGYNFYNTYYEIGASLLHIRKFKNAIIEENTALKECPDDFRCYTYEYNIYIPFCFTNMASFASNVCYTDLIRLDL